MIESLTSFSLETASITWSSGTSPYSTIIYSGQLSQLQRILTFLTEESHEAFDIETPVSTARCFFFFFHSTLTLLSVVGYSREDGQLVHDVDSQCFSWRINVRCSFSLIMIRDLAVIK